ncbi:MAG: hypothetical protein ABIT70_11005 [Sulfuriferula sp.]
MKLLLALFSASTILLGCATPTPEYIEPNPKSEPTAQMRVAILVGVSAIVLAHDNNNGPCLSYVGVTVLPVAINTWGFPQSNIKRVGMPPGENEFGRAITELYIPAGKQITISARYSGGNGMMTMNCYRAFRFQPIRGKNYELSLMTGVGNNVKLADSCILELKEILVRDAQPPKLISIPVEPIIVKGRPAWERLCSASK